MLKISKFDWELLKCIAAIKKKTEIFYKRNCIFIEHFLAVCYKFIILNSVYIRQYPPICSLLFYKSVFNLYTNGQADNKQKFNIHTFAKGKERHLRHSFREVYKV